MPKKRTYFHTAEQLIAWMEDTLQATGEPVRVIYVRLRPADIIIKKALVRPTYAQLIECERLEAFVSFYVYEDWIFED